MFNCSCDCLTYDLISSTTACFVIQSYFIDIGLVFLSDILSPSFNTLPKVDALDLVTRRGQHLAGVAISLAICPTNRLVELSAHVPIWAWLCCYITVDWNKT